jgi:hypothetical protein
LFLGKKNSADKGVSAANSNKLAERLGKSAFYSAEIIGENILRSMVAKLAYNTVLRNLFTI